MNVLVVHGWKQESIWRRPEVLAHVSAKGVSGLQRRGVPVDAAFLAEVSNENSLV